MEIVFDDFLGMTDL